MKYKLSELIEFLEGASKLQEQLDTSDAKPLKQAAQLLQALQPKQISELPIVDGYSDTILCYGVHEKRIDKEWCTGRRFLTVYTTDKLNIEGELDVIDVGEYNMTATHFIPLEAINMLMPDHIVGTNKKVMEEE